MVAIRTGETLARQVAARIAAAVATTAAVTAISSADRVDRMLILEASAPSGWMFLASSTTPAQDGVLAPDSGTGRWHRVSGASAGGAGVDYKGSVKVASAAALDAYTRTGNVLLANANGAMSTVDGTALVAGDRFLLKDGAAGADNGIYVLDSAGGAGKWQATRASDADTSAEMTAGHLVPIAQGTANGDKWFFCSTNDAITLNSTSITYTLIPNLADLASTSNGKGASLVSIEDAAGIITATQTETAFAELAKLALGAGGFKARYVMTTNVAALATFTVLQDGVTGLAGEKVLLVGQTTKSENGLYVLGTVGGGTAPLTRAPEMAATFIITSGTKCQVQEGTIFAQSEWKLTTTGAITVGTTAHDWYPKSVTVQLILSAGTGTISTVPILSATKTGIGIARTVPNTSTLTTGGYGPSHGGATGITAGVVGTGSVVIDAEVAAGTLNNADISTLNVTITNW